MLVLKTFYLTVNHILKAIMDKNVDWWPCWSPPETKETATTFHRTYKGHRLCVQQGPLGKRRWFGHIDSDTRIYGKKSKEIAMKASEDYVDKHYEEVK